MAITRKLALMCGMVVLASVLTLVVSPGQCGGPPMGPHMPVGPSFGPPPGPPPMMQAPPMFQPPPQPGGPLCGPPMCMPQPCVLAAAEPSVYAGYLIKDNGLTLDFDANEGNLGGVTDFRHDFTLQGILLEVSVPVTLSTGMGMMLSAGHVFPFEERSREIYNQGQASRNWSTDQQWWYVQGAGTYAVHPFVSLVGGFRWDSWMCNFADPEDPVVIATSTPEDRADVTFSGYIPFGGIVFHKPPDCSGHSYMGGVIGFPVLWASWDYNQTFGALAERISGDGEITEGHFLEAFAEYSIHMGNLSVGAFGRYTSLYGRDSSLTLKALSGTFGPQDFSFKFDRRHWAFGAKASVSFTTPL